MLRITRLADDRAARMLRLEGKLVGPWVAELAVACADEARMEGLRLDLSAVSYVDGEGLRLLRALLGRGAEVCCTGLVAEMLFGEKR
jgi:hypothetical protein